MGDGRWETGDVGEGRGAKENKIWREKIRGLLLIFSANFNSRLQRRNNLSNCSFLRSFENIRHIYDFVSLLESN